MDNHFSCVQYDAAAAAFLHPGVVPHLVAGWLDAGEDSVHACLPANKHQPGQASPGYLSPSPTRKSGRSKVVGGDFGEKGPNQTPTD